MCKTLVFGLVLIGACAASSPAQNGIALVELFSSEGCSSCPAAERVLHSLQQEMAAKGKPLLWLTYHVTYWDYLGWKDPYGMPQADERQRGYVHKLQLRTPYTPQAVVNGKHDVVGSDGITLREAVGAAIQPSATTLTATATYDTEKKQYIITYTTQAAPPGGILWLAVAEQQRTQWVNTGENTGRTLTHYGLVRHLQQLATAPHATVRVAAPRGVSAASVQLVLWLQQGTHGQVLAATATVLQ